MSCSEDTIVLIPFQRILTKISHRLSQIRDVGGVSGDIGGIRRHGIVGGFQLRAVNGIGAASRQVAIFNVGDFAGGLGRFLVEIIASRPWVYMAFTACTSGNSAFSC